jgi:hypothetical protein
MHRLLAGHRDHLITISPFFGVETPGKRPGIRQEGQANPTRNQVQPNLRSFDGKASIWNWKQGTAGNG